MAASCECGHGIDEHAEFIDNQRSSPNPVVERRHCMHGFGKPGRCECYRYRPVVNAEFEVTLATEKPASMPSVKSISIATQATCSITCPSCKAELLLSTSLKQR